jgi:putative tributyrin esterase
MALLHVNFHSNTLGMATQMDVILPQTADTAPYKTLYLLHGMSDDHTIWQRRTSIERYADAKGIAVVMPSTDLGWYTDMAHGLRYYTYIGEELPKICRGFFPRMSAAREDNYIAGLSMGGYGAFKFALGFPDKFAAAASLSGAIAFNGGADNNPLWRNVFGDLDKFKGSENDLFWLAKKLKESGKPLPKLYIWCGTEDFLYEGNVIMRGYLNDLGYDLTYEESAGDHQWKYWDEKIQTVLDWIG